MNGVIMQISDTIESLIDTKVNTKINQEIVELYSTVSMKSGSFDLHRIN